MHHCVFAHRASQHEGAVAAAAAGDAALRLQPTGARPDRDHGQQGGRDQREGHVRALRADPGRRLLRGHQTPGMPATADTECYLQDATLSVMLLSTAWVAPARPRMGPVTLVPTPRRCSHTAVTCRCSRRTSPRRTASWTPSAARGTGSGSECTARTAGTRCRSGTPAWTIRSCTRPASSSGPSSRRVRPTALCAYSLLGCAAALSRALHKIARSAATHGPVGCPSKSGLMPVPQQSQDEAA